MITLRRLTKQYGDKKVVDGLTFDVPEAKVTGFLGPNGAGKSTTMRVILGLDRPTQGEALIGGKAYADLEHPLRHVGALLDAKALHPARTARKHLLAMARSNGFPAGRVDEVLDTVGLTSAADKRMGAFSLGMGQRLGIAGALLGDPELLIFDEPVNGLDPDGVRWIRGLMRSLAREGRTVFVSSHLMSEMQLTADHLIVIARGRVIMDAPTEQVIAGSTFGVVKVRVPDPHQLHTFADGLVADRIGVRRTGPEHLTLSGAGIERIGDIAHHLGIRLHELTAPEPSLEEAFMELTNEGVEYRAPGTRSDTPQNAQHGGGR
ncbi:ABC transporter ATP-binding protein [Streptomyces parvus]|uniref:ABC transporter ATP-binding protein n=1 Tax=Streptomyces parvus TaxID=66428 RepID=A0A5D4IH69_9ACTN|nr:ABC transporter ATP-binding protein [Streptomyces parvus]TYR51053.1 ABC transporter ATP-binding protein [Streptomyces parvus]